MSVLLFLLLPGRCLGVFSFLGAPLLLVDFCPRGHHQPGSYIYHIYMKSNITYSSKPAGTSPGLTRSQQATRDTVAINQCVPRIILRDIINVSYVQSEGNYYFKNNNEYKTIKPSQVLLPDCLKSSVSDPTATLTKCGIKNCKTCSILITSPQFSSNLTGKSYHTKCLEPLDCTTNNVIYGIDCSLCGLVYVGETGQTLRSRMNGHRHGVNSSLDFELYKHFNQVDHSILSMRVRILEKIYHHTNSTTLSSPFRRERENYWIRQLATGMTTSQI